MHRGHDYIISLVTPVEAKEVAAEIAVIDEAWLHGKYDAIDADDYGRMPEVPGRLRLHMGLFSIVAAVFQAGR